jgi:phospholipase C
MPSKQQTFKAVLRAGAAVLASLPMIAGPALAAPAHGANDNRTTTPIKHVIVIVGENRSFDHLFATYVSPSGDAVRNILSEGVVNADGTPGPAFAQAQQFRASDTTTFSISPTITGPYLKLPPPNVGFAPSQQSATRAPFISTTIAAQYDHGVLPRDLDTLTTGATGLAFATIDTRIAGAHRLASGPYQLSPGVTSDDYANSPAHRYYQMFQQLDCNVAYATSSNPSGCRADLFPWVEASVGAGASGAPRPPNFTDESTHEGATSMGFYNVQQGDAPYLKALADRYTLLDNYHQPAMGGTFLDSMYLAYADDIWFSDGRGHPATPSTGQIENPDPQRGTNNWYVQDGYLGGSYSNCSDIAQPGVAAISAYLGARGVGLNCDAAHYYLLNNYNPGYLGDGQVVNRAQAPLTLPPSSTPSIADVLIAGQISWTYFGEGWNQFVADPNFFGPYCQSCNPFQYETKIMTGADRTTGIPYRLTYLKDTTDLYDDVRTGELPAVSYVKPGALNDGHPESSKISIFEAFVRKVVTEVAANPELAANTAILITVDEGGGYYDSGFIQQLDFFGDGTRIPLIIVSPYTTGGHVSHVYADHASVVKFIEANWGLGPITSRSRDNLPNPVTSLTNPYVPTNGPSISDLMAAFHF